MKSKHFSIVAGLAVSFFTAGNALAQTGPGMMLVPWQEDQIGNFTAEGFFSPTEANITNADVDLAIFDAAGRLRLDPDSSYNPTIGFDYTHFNVGTTDAALPDRLTDMSAAIGFSFGDVNLSDTLGGNWQMGATLGVGYAGTAPFNDSDALYFTANVFGVKPIDRDHRWIVGLNYDGNRVFLPDVPLPAVTYFGRASETVTYGLGFPFSTLTYKPDDRWTVELRSVLFMSFDGKVSYKAAARLHFFAGYFRRSDAFKPSGAPDNRRLLFSQDKAEVGVVFGLEDNIALTVAGGYALRQEFDFGYDVRDPVGVRDLDDAGYIRVGLAFSF